MDACGPGRPLAVHVDRTAASAMAPFESSTMAWGRSTRPGGWRAFSHLDLDVVVREATKTSEVSAAARRRSFLRRRSSSSSSTTEDSGRASFVSTHHGGGGPRGAARAGWTAGATSAGARGACYHC